MSRTLLALPLLAALAAGPSSALAEHPIQLSLVPPVQLVPEGQSVSGLRLSLLYGKNVNVGGLDVSLVGQATGTFTGLQLGLVGIVGSDFTGWQDNWAANVVGGKMTGFQWGIYNQAQRVEGLQLGIVNRAGTIHGLQVGIINLIEQGGWLPAMIIANGNFN
jgi:hypothetical protein